MKLKKLFICLAAAVMLLTAMTVNVFAANPMVTCENKSLSLDKLNIGDILEIEITLSDAPELNTIMLNEFTYDKTVLELVEGSFVKLGQLYWNIGEDESEFGSMATSFLKKQNFNGSLATVKFKVIGKSVGTYDINFTVSASYNDDNNNNVPTVLGLTAGKITITCPHANKTKTEAKAATCTAEGNNAYYTCSDCGTVLKEDGKTETTVEAEKLAMLAHTYEKHEKVEPTHTTAGMDEYYTCSVCSKIFDADKKEVNSTDGFKLPELTEHAFGEEWKKDETNHWHECVCGEKADEAKHTLVEKIDTEPTEDAAGVGHDECEVCGYVTNEGKEIPMLEHTHAMEKVSATAATCVDKATVEHYTCTKCHKNFSDEAGKNELTDITTGEVDLTNHVGEERLDNKADATCSKEGYTGDIVCTSCGTVKEEGKPIEKVPHDEEVRDAKEADCTNEGYTGDTYCKVCGEKTKTGTPIPVDPAKHNYEWKVDKEPTFEETGLKHKECTICGDRTEIDTVIEKKDCAHSTMEHHDKVAATCTKTGTAEYWHCTECDRNYSDEKGTLKIEDLVLPIDPENHIKTELRNVKSATCTTEGFSGDKYCSDCDKLIENGSTIPVDSNAHNYVGNRCEYCGHIRSTYYDYAIIYVNDENHLSGGVLARHIPDSMTMHTDGVYEWRYCAYCHHEYGKVAVVDINVGDSVDLIVDDPVQSGDDEPIPDVPATEPEPTEPAEPVEDNNPPTGIAIAVLPMVLAAAAAIASKKMNK